MVNKSIYLSTAGRCGTHWVKHILSEVLHLDYQSYRKEINFDPNDVPFRTKSEFIEWVKEKERMDYGGRIYAAHTPIKLLSVIQDVVNVIILIRDPRDICISASYFDLKDKIFNKEDFNESLEMYIKKGGSNPDFNDSFIKDRKGISHKVLKFEDLKKDTYSVLKELLDEFHYNYDGSKLKEAIKNKSFKSLSGREIGFEDKNAHYRKGIVGDWKNYLDEERNRAFCETHKKLMKEWGYTL